MTPVAWAGLCVLAGCLAVIAAELVATAIILTRARRRWRAWQGALDPELFAIERQLEQLAASSGENGLLLAPYQRFVERLRTPVALTLWQAYRRGRERD